MSDQPQSIDTGVIIRRTAFLIVLVALTLGNLFPMFRGLNSPHAMDQAQLAREIARGNVWHTKVLRPAAIYQVEKVKGTVSLIDFQDTYHAPLNPMINAAVLKLIGADSADDWRMNRSQMVFPLDRIIAAVSTLFFLMSIGVTYLLVSRIFDAKIAGVCAVLMLFCEIFWNFSLSGLPQMLLMLLFSCGLYFTYRAVESTSEGRVAVTPALLAGLFFTLMSLAHWLCAWIAIGYIIFAAFAFRPRGIIGISVLAMLFLAASATMVSNSRLTGSPFGTSFLMLYRGLGINLDEAMIMRTGDLGSQPLTLDGFVLKTLRAMILQVTDIVPFLGGIVLAPIFFIALFHPFKRPSIARFRWAVVALWLPASLGMAIFGVSSKELDPNQIHLVFAPIMTAYAIAFISILWSRLEFTIANPVVRNLHLIAMVALCAAPLIIALPPKIKRGMDRGSEQAIPWWPPYYPPALNLGLKNWIKDDQMCFSDQPWAVAWYADRTSIWLPTTKKGFDDLESTASTLGTPCTGILITPSSYGSDSIGTVAAQYGEFTSLVMDGRVFGATYPPGFTTFDKDPKLQTIFKQYSFRANLFGIYEMVFYSDRPLRTSEAN